MATNNAESGGSVTSNPAGFIYEAHISYLQETDDESAWDAESEGLEQFDGKNWASYFTYTPCCLCE